MKNLLFIFAMIHHAIRENSVKLVIFHGNIFHISNGKIYFNIRKFFFCFYSGFFNRLFINIQCYYVNTG